LKLQTLKQSHLQRKGFSIIATTPAAEKVCERLQSTFATDPVQFYKHFEDLDEDIDGGKEKRIAETTFPILATYKGGSKWVGYSSAEMDEKESGESSTASLRLRRAHFHSQEGSQKRMDPLDVENWIVHICNGSASWRSVEDSPLPITIED
jgi:hypothetical protein